VKGNRVKGFINFLKVLFFLVLIGSVGLGLFYLIRLIYISIVGLESDLAIAIITAAATVLVSVVTVVIGKNLEKKREIEQQHRIQKTEIYENFMKGMFKVMNLTKTSSGVISQDELNKFVEEFNRKLILWGGRNVIKEYMKFKKFGNDVKNKGNTEILILFEKVLYAIRKDLGHSNLNLVSKDLLSLIIKDIEKLDISKTKI